MKMIIYSTLFTIIASAVLASDNRCTQEGIEARMQDMINALAKIEKSNPKRIAELKPEMQAMDLELQATGDKTEVCAYMDSIIEEAK
jgi:hypothetical protein